MLHTRQRARGAHILQVKHEETSGGDGVEETAADRLLRRRKTTWHTHRHPGDSGCGKVWWETHGAVGLEGDREGGIFLRTGESSDWLKI